MLLARSVYLTLLGVCLQGKHVLRLRASIFVNLAAMRSCMSKNRNQGCLLSAENLSILCRSNYLFHSALNSLLDAKSVWCMTWFKIFCKLSAIVLLLLIVAARLSTGGN